MAADDRLEAGGGRIEVERVEVVQDIEDDVPDANDLRVLQRLRPILTVVVPPHGDHRSHFAQRLQHVGTADVTGVDDQLRAAQGVDRLWTHQTVGVGDHPDDSAGSCHALRLMLTPSLSGTMLVSSSLSAYRSRVSSRTPLVSSSRCSSEATRPDQSM